MADEVRCPVCHKRNPADARICAFCATPLSNRCDRCQFENPPGFRYCGNCGFRIGETESHTPLAHLGTTTSLTENLLALMPEAFAEKIAAARGQAGMGRREVTVLFLDLQGFTTFSERQDPESVFARINRLRRVFVEVIFQYEGSVDKFTGDGLMALFGVPVAHENDPERACRAALEMQRRLSEMNHDWGERGLEMRIGLNTGQVVAGRIGHDLRMEYTVIGDTVNVAQRLEAIAEPGTVLVSASTFERVAPLFDVIDLGQLHVKGRQEPVRCFQLERLRYSGDADAAHFSSPFVNRKRELEQLLDVAAETREGRGQLVLLTGEAGIGKSRLIAEWKRHLNPQLYRILLGASLSYRQPISYWPFITVLETLFNIVEGDSSEERWAKLRDGLRAHLPEVAPEELLPFLAYFLHIPIPDPAMAQQVQQQAPPQLRQQTFIAVRVLLTSLAVQQPLFLVLEDLHLADSATLDLLYFLLGKSDNVPLTFILVTRYQEGPIAERLQRMVEREARGTVHIELGPLDSEAMATLFDQLLLPRSDSRTTAPMLPASTRRHLLGEAGGNPFFLEELLAMWAEQGSIVQRAGPLSRLDEQERGERAIPPALNAMITARLDRLTPEERRTLQLASVIGRTFPQTLLQHVAQHDAHPIAVAAILPELQRQGLVQEVGESGEATQWSFRHPLVREAIYHVMLQQERRDLHALVGSSIELLFPAGSGGDRSLGIAMPRAELIAHHYEEAEEWDRALPYLIQVTEGAAAGFDNERTVRYGERALRLTEHVNIPAAEQSRLHELVADSYMFDHDYDQADLHYQAAISISESIGAPALREVVELYRKWARLKERQGEYDEALHCLSTALAELERHPSEELNIARARVLNDLGWVSFKLGDAKQAQSLAFRSLKLLEGSGAVNDLASAYNRLVATYSVEGKWREAFRFAHKSLKLRSSLGFQPGVALSYETMATLLIYLGQWAQAREYTERMLIVAHTISAPDLEAQALLLHATLDLYEGRLESAHGRAEQARTIAELLESRPLQLSAYQALSHIESARGNMKQAHRFVLRALEVAHLLNARENLSEVLSEYAAILRERSRAHEAIYEAEHALQIATELGTPIARARAHRVLATCALALGDPARAEIHFRRAGRLFARLNLDYELARTEVHMAHLRREQQRMDEARHLLRRAVRTFETLGARTDLHVARQRLASWQPDGEVVLPGNKE